MNNTQDIETKDNYIINNGKVEVIDINKPVTIEGKITLPRIKWLEPSEPVYKKTIYSYDTQTKKTEELTNNIKHLSLLERLKRMFKI